MGNNGVPVSSSDGIRAINRLNSDYRKITDADWLITTILDSVLLP